MKHFLSPQTCGLLALCVTFLFCTPLTLYGANKITMGVGSGNPGGVSKHVIVTAANDVALSGYSLAFTFPIDTLELTGVSVVGTHVNVLEPQFVAPFIDNQLGIGSLAVIFPALGPSASINELPPLAPGAYPNIIARLTFNVKGSAQGGIYPLKLRNGIGQPAAFTHFSDRGTTIAPEMVHGSFIVDGGNVLSVEKKFSFAGNQGVTMFAYAQHSAPLDGLSVGLIYAKTGLTMASDATFDGTSLGFELGGQIEQFNFDLDTNFSPTHARSTAQALFDYLTPFDGQSLSPNTEPATQSVVKYRFNVSLAADDTQQFQELTLHNCFDSGSGCENAPLATDNRFFFGGSGLDPRLVHGKIYFSTGNITGTVVDSVSGVGAGAVLVVTDPDEFQATTDASGFFRIDDVTPGQYSLLLSRTAYYSSRQLTTEAGDPIEVTGLGADSDIGEIPLFKIPSGGPVRPFQRGYLNPDNKFDLSDPIFLLSYLFQGGLEPGCFLAGDMNDDTNIDLSDAIWALQYLFGGGTPPLPPFDDCGADPTPSGDLGCDESLCP